MVVQHSTYDYLLRWLGVETVADLEPKPGLPPSAGHLSRLLATEGLDQASAILVSWYQDERPARWMNDRTGVPVLALPSTVVPGEAPATLEALIDQIIDALLAVNGSADNV